MPAVDDPVDIERVAPLTACAGASTAAVSPPTARAGTRRALRAFIRILRNRTADISFSALGPLSGQSREHPTIGPCSSAPQPRGPQDILATPSPIFRMTSSSALGPRFGPVARVFQPSASVRRGGTRRLGGGGEGRPRFQAAAVAGEEVEQAAMEGGHAVGD